MTTTWILVAHNAGARCFENGGPGKGIELIEEIGHPEGRQSEGELQADRPGRSFQRNSGDTRRSAMSPPQSAQERIVADFAGTLASRLQQARVSGKLDRLVLVAPPKLLGLLRSALDAPTAHCVVGSLDKNLAMSDQDELVKHLGEVIAV
jgi:protein required for attachment to host cells